MQFGLFTRRPGLTENPANTKLFAQIDRILCLVAVYLGSYLSLSLSGAYMPATYGTNGIKDWAWTPRGFACDSGRFRVWLVIPFFPLYWTDLRFWHNDWTGLSGPQKMPMRLNQNTPAIRRPNGQSNRSENLSATLAAGRAFPAAVAEFWSLGAKEDHMPWAKPNSSSSPS